MRDRGRGARLPRALAYLYHFYDEVGAAIDRLAALGGVDDLDAPAA